MLGYHDDPAAVVAGADVFTLSSRHEGLPIALLEAMALGVPPVVTAVGGNAEVVTDDDGRAARARRAIPSRWRRPTSSWPGTRPTRARLGAAAAARAEAFDIAAHRPDPRGALPQPRGTLSGP